MIELLLLTICIILSGLFSGSEIAFFSLSDAKIHTLVDQKIKGASYLKKIKLNSDKLLITILIGNNIVNIGSSALATYLATEAFGSQGVGIATGVMTLLILTFGEIVPKSLAAKYAAEVALIMAFPIYVLMYLLTPISIGFEYLLKITNKILGSNRTPAPVVTEEEVKAMSEIGLKVGVVEDHENEFIQNIFSLNDTKVSEAMTPKKYVHMVSGEKYLSQIIRDVISKHYSRVPVYMGDRNNIIGFLLVKEVLKYPRSNWAKIQVKDVIRKPLYVRDSKILIDLYEKFIAEKIHIAIVKNSKKKVVGLITMEDIIEEVLGEIDDEEAQLI